MKGTRGSTRNRTRSRLALAVLLAGSLTWSGIPPFTPPALAAPVKASHPGQPAIPDPVSVPVHPVVGTDASVPDTPTVQPPAPVWPAAGAAVADRTAASASSAVSASRDTSGAVRAGNLPVWVGP